MVRAGVMVTITGCCWSAFRVLWCWLGPRRFGSRRHGCNGLCALPGRGVGYDGCGNRRGGLGGFAVLGCLLDWWCGVGAVFGIHPWVKGPALPGTPGQRWLAELVAAYMAVLGAEGVPLDGLVMPASVLADLLGLAGVPLPVPVAEAVASVSVVLVE